MNDRFGFLSNGKLYLTKCPKCLKENYYMGVTVGICSWCGYDGNNDDDFIDSLKDMEKKYD